MSENLSSSTTRPDQAVLTAPDMGAEPSEAYRRWVLLCLLLVTVFNVVDRSVINVVGEAIRRDLQLNDFQLGLLGGPAFGVLYALGILPIARLADRFSRVRILSVCVAAWSLMTALCGLATSFAGLLFARMGVGLGEAGGGTPSISLVCDYFPPARRATAIGVTAAGSAVGVLVAAAGSGLLVQHFGWRAAFMVVGLPGLALALLFIATVREPQRGRYDAAVAGTEVPPLMAVVRHLRRAPSFIHIVLVACLASFVNYGLGLFLHPLLVRHYQLDYALAGLVFGGVTAIASGGGCLLSGVLTDRLVQRDVRYYAWIPLAGLSAAAVLMVAGVLQSDWRWAALLLAGAGLCTYLWFSPGFALTQRLVEGRMRATGTALLTLGAALIGTGIGPAAVGFVSDALAGTAFVGGDYALLCKTRPIAPDILSQCAAASASGLRQTLLLLPIILLWGALHSFLAARHLRRDLAGTACAVPLKETPGRSQVSLTPSGGPTQSAGSGGAQ